jgi:hypothetical protein
MPQEVDRPGEQGHKWRPVEYERRQACQLSNPNGCTGFGGGQCLPSGDPNNLLGTCEIVQGVCDDSEREQLGEFLLNTARATPHNDIFGNSAVVAMATRSSPA